MAISDKLSQLLRVVHEQTRLGAINWEKSAKPNAFQAAFTRYSVMILAESGIPVLQIYDEKGTLIEAVNIRQTSQAQDEMLKDLFERARRQALGVDRAIDEIVEELTAEEKK